MFRLLRSVTLFVAMLLAVSATAQDSDAEAEALANANNPLADMVAFNIQNYYYSALYGTDETANTAWLRYVQPFGKWLMRASLPRSSRSWRGARAHPAGES